MMEAVLAEMEMKVVSGAGGGAPKAPTDATDEEQAELLMHR